MKRILLILLLFIGITETKAQDPNIYNTWYLYSYEYDLGDIFFVADIDPAIAPTITIETDLTYVGNAACNAYGGDFSYDPVMDVLNIDSFGHTLLGCDFPSHEQFELDYWGFFTSGDFFYYWVTETSLQLEFAPGFVLTFGLDPLSVNEFNSADISIYPNPVRDELFISSEGMTIDGLAIYSVSGQQLISNYGQVSSLDVSPLSEGVYFIEILSEGRKQVVKFIKR